MRCFNVRRLLYALAEGALSEEKERALQEHLSSCARCNKEYKKLNTLLHLASEKNLGEMSNAFWADFDKELKEKLSQEVPPALEIKFKPRYRLYRIPKPVYAFATAAVLLIVISFYLLGGLPTPGRISNYQDQLLISEIQTLEELSGEFFIIDENDLLFDELIMINGTS